MKIIDGLSTNKPIVQHGLLLFDTRRLWSLQIWLAHYCFESLYGLHLFPFQSILFIFQFLELFIKGLLWASSSLPFLLFFHQFLLNLFILSTYVIQLIILILTQQGSWLGFLNHSWNTLYLDIRFVYILIDWLKVSVLLLVDVDWSGIFLLILPYFSLLSPGILV